MREVGWTGGCVPCKSRCCCLSPLFGEEMSVWVQWGKNHSSLRPVRQLTWKDCFQHLWNLKDTPVSFGGTMRLPGDGVVLLGGVSEETAGCGFLWPYPWLVLNWWDLAQVMDKSLVPMAGPVLAGQLCALVTSDTSAAITLQEGNNLKLGKQENSFQKAWKLARFMLRITPLPQYPEWIMPNFPCTQAHTQNPALGYLNNRNFRRSSSWKEGIWNKSVLWSRTTKCVSLCFDI